MENKKKNNDNINDNQTKADVSFNQNARVKLK